MKLRTTLLLPVCLLTLSGCSLSGHSKTDSASGKSRAVDSSTVKTTENSTTNTSKHSGENEFSNTSPNQTYSSMEPTVVKSNAPQYLNPGTIEAVDGIEGYFRLIKNTTLPDGFEDYSNYTVGTIYKGEVDQGSNVIDMIKINLTLTNMGKAPIMINPAHFTITTTDQVRYGSQIRSPYNFALDPGAKVTLCNFVGPVNLHALKVGWSIDYESKLIREIPSGINETTKALQMDFYPEPNMFEDTSTEESDAYYDDDEEYYDDDEEYYEEDYDDEDDY